MIGYSPIHDDLRFDRVTGRYLYLMTPREKTVFVTPKGSVQYRVMPFGLENA